MTDNCCHVQTARHTKLEQTKHCLVLLKKACRAATTTSWKQLRCKMEQELAERLAVQQKDMDEQLAFVQVTGDWYMHQCCLLVVRHVKWYGLTRSPQS